MSTHKIFDACDFLEKLKPSNKQKNNNMCQVPCASNNAKFKRNGFVQIQNCFFIFTLEEAILTDQMNHQFGPRKPSFHVFFLVPRNSGSKPWWNHTANVVHAHRSNFNARPPRCDRVRKSGEFRGKKKKSKTQPLQCSKLRKFTMFTVHRLGFRQLELNKKHHLHYTFQGNAGMSCNYV